MNTEENKKRTQPTKVQAVLTEALKSQLDSFKAEKGYKNDGEALRAILTTFFNGDTTNGGTTEHLENRIEALEKALYHDDMDISQRAEEAFNEYKGLEDAYNDVAESQREQSAKIRALEKQIEELKSSTQQPSQAQDISEDITDISEDNEPVEAVESTANEGEELKKGFSGVKLAKRLGLSYQAISKQRDKGEDSFKDWSKKKDPDNIPWRYDSEDKKYHPVN